MPSLLDNLAAKTARRFEARFGAAPRWIVAAPGRVNLIGEHIDYSDGFVLPLALDRYTVIAAGEAPGEQATLFSDLADDAAAISIADPQPHPNRGHWSNYVAGVIAGWISSQPSPFGRGQGEGDSGSWSTLTPALSQGERGRKRPSAFRAVIGSDVPLGGGLSSSAALEVATATLLEAMTGTALDGVEKALLCQWAEHNFPGVPCGIMDQFASALCQADHLMLLDCRSQEVEPIPFTNPNVTVLIINSNVKHELTGGEYAERRGQCEAAVAKLGLKSMRDATLELLEKNRAKLSEVEYRRARHAIGEIARTADAAAAMKAGDLAQFGRHMVASHESLRDDYEVSCAELDLLVKLAQGIGRDGGVYGSRMTGGGFGGCTVSLVETARVDDVAKKITADYKHETGIDPTVLTCRPSRGAHVLKK
jgi:galactokinase